MKIRPSRNVRAVAEALAIYTNDSGKDGHERGVVNARALGLSKHPRPRKAPKAKRHDLRTKRGRDAVFCAVRAPIGGVVAHSPSWGALTYASPYVPPARGPVKRRLTARTKSGIAVMARAQRKLKGY